MQDDIISALTQEVKEEVIQNYLYERRLMEEQIKYVEELAEHAAQLVDKLYRRFARMYEILSEPGLIDQFVQLIGMKEAVFETRFRKDPNFRKELPFIKVRGVTPQRRFKKLLLESYRRLFDWNKTYEEAYENLEQESRAVNQNLKKFERDHDILTILNFLKDMDIEQIQRKHFLGDNFTPEEMASVETSLRFKPIRMEQFKLIPPPGLLKPDAVKRELGALANRVYDECGNRIRTLMK